MRKNITRTSVRAAVRRMDANSMIEPGIAFLLAMLVSWAISAL